MGPGGRLFWVYVALAAVGAVFPYLIVLPWVAEFGVAPGLFLLQVFATTPSTAFASDVIYSAAVFLLFLFVEGRRLGMRGLWFPALLVIAVGLCCALPTFLAMRERALGDARG